MRGMGAGARRSAREGGKRHGETSSDGAPSGFTAIEVLVALSIVALLVALGAVLFKRHAVGARVAEATSMLTELAGKEEAYRAASGRYVSLRADGRAGAPDEAPAAYYPAPADSPALGAPRSAVRVDDSSRWPAGWKTIDVRPRAGSLSCTYLVNTGERGRPLPGGEHPLRFGPALTPNDDGRPWFYALAACNLDGATGYPDGVTVFGVSSQDGQVHTFTGAR
jgi:prepilin-type N-terminal cleavage/methylation domain-containing protein